MALAVSAISLLGWLALNVTNFHNDAQRLAWRRTAQMALSWFAIISLLAWLVTQLEQGGPSYPMRHLT